MNQVPSAGRPVPIGVGHVLCRTSRQPDGVGAAAQRLGYPIQTSEGAIGHVIDFIMDDKSWEICHLVVETGHRYSGKEIVISPKHIDRISYEESKVFANVTKDAILEAPQYHVSPLGEAYGDTRNFD
jgi:hypothetical protein